MKFKLLKTLRARKNLKMLKYIIKVLMIFCFGALIMFLFLNEYFNDEINYYKTEYSQLIKVRADLEEVIRESITPDEFIGVVKHSCVFIRTNGEKPNRTFGIAPDRHELFAIRHWNMTTDQIEGIYGNGQSDWKYWLFCYGWEDY